MASNVTTLGLDTTTANDDADNYNWIIAVLLAAAASFISNLGVTLQKVHHMHQQSLESTHPSAASLSPANSAVAIGGAAKIISHNSRQAPKIAPSLSESHSTNITPSYSPVPTHRRSIASPPPLSSLSDSVLRPYLWAIGLLFIILGSLFDFAALSFGPQSLVAPLGSMTLVSNVLFAHFLLGENVARRDVCATFLIVAGSTLAIAFGSHEDKVFSVGELYASFLVLGFVLYALITCAAIAYFYLTILKLERIEYLHGNNSFYYAPYRSWHRFCYPALSGIVGAQSVLFAKCSVELLVNTFGTVSTSSDTKSTIENNDNGYSSNMFLYPQSYVILASMTATILLQIKFLNDGLRRFSATYTVPVFQAFWIIVSVVSGLIYYEEYNGLYGNDGIWFTLGVAITIGGVTLLTYREELNESEIEMTESARNRLDIDVDDMELNDDAIEPRRHPQPQHSSSYYPNGKHTTIHYIDNDDEETKEDRTAPNVRLLDPDKDQSSMLVKSIPRVWESLTSKLQSNGYLKRNTKYQKVSLDDQDDEEDDLDGAANDREENIMHNINHGNIPSHDHHLSDGDEEKERTGTI